ncbi:MAG: SIMPL domain-containing protein, partial [Candidatus Terrybacteria bacterium]|nr:SIMPL domain-containing protein [Candidatus Terrybacteria bacterium]
IGEFSFSVVTEGGKNLSALQQANSEKANRIIAYLKESGVDEEDITTRMYDVSPRYQYYSCPPSLPIAVEDETVSETRPCPPPEIAGYTITQSISVKVRDLEDVGDFLSGVVDRGADNVSGLSFTVDDPDEVRGQAREEAVAEAKEKAQAMALAGGFSVGKLVSISEDFGGLPVAPFAERGLGVGGGGDAPVIEPGSQEIRVSVTLTYELR